MQDRCVANDQVAGTRRGEGEGKIKGLDRFGEDVEGAALIVVRTGYQLRVVTDDCGIRLGLEPLYHYVIVPTCTKSLGASGLLRVRSKK